MQSVMGRGGKGRQMGGTTLEKRKRVKKSEMKNDE